MRTRRFAPLFWTQFCGAFNDNLFKNALVMLITYRIGSDITLDIPTLLSLQTALFILPFFLFSALAGQFADKYDKAQLARIIKLIEMGLAIFAVLSLVLHNFYMLFAVLFLFGTHSAFFGPIKYAILPELLEPEELLAGNGLIEAGTLIAVLLGTIMAGLFTLQDNGVEMIGASICLIAYIGYSAAREIPATAPSTPHLKIDWNIITDTARILRSAFQNRHVKIAIIGISWFWLIGAAYVTLLPALVKNNLGGDSTVVTLFFMLFSIGIAIGSVLCSKIMHDRISTKIIPLAALGISIFTADLWWNVDHFMKPAELIGFRAFLENANAWRLVVDLTGLAISGGIYVVPLYTILQAKSDPQHRARMLAANNIMNALFMVLASVVSLQLLTNGLQIHQVLVLYGSLTAIWGLWIYHKWAV